MSCFVLLFGEEERDGSAAHPPPPIQGDWGEQMLSPRLYHCSRLPNAQLSALTCCQRDFLLPAWDLGRPFPLMHLKKSNIAMGIKTPEQSRGFLCLFQEADGDAGCCDLFYCLTSKRLMVFLGFV